MAAKTKGRVAPRIDEDELTESFAEQLASGAVCHALAAAIEIPALTSVRGQPLRIDECVWQEVRLGNPAGQRLRAADVRIESSDLANFDLSESLMERVEVISSRLTGAQFVEAQLKSVLFRECRLDLAQFRMARLSQCVFEQCNLADADFYGADLTGAILRGCDLSRADVSHARLGGADIRDCRLDGLRGLPASLEGLRISADQAPLVVTLFGVRVG
jgi:uncharacterized protein YjbI with pentapeptide repeats